jgi:hypothetical protein
MLFSIPKNELDSIEDENIQRNLKRVFRNTLPDNFNDPNWQREIKEYYHNNIKELQIASDKYDSLSINVKNINLIFFLFGLIFGIIGSLYSLIYNLNLIQDSSKNLTILLDYSFIYLSLYLGIHLYIDFKEYKNNKKDYLDIIKAQRARLGNVYWGLNNNVN